MEDALINRANSTPDDPRRAASRNRFERQSSTACRFVQGVGGTTVAYLASDLLEAVVASGATEKLIEALLCARRIASDEGFDAGRENVRSGFRSLLGLAPEVAASEES